MKPISNTIKQLAKVSVADFKLIFRDPSLWMFLFLPVLIFAVINVFLPYLTGRYEAVNAYVPHVLIVATVENTQMFGFIYSMVFIEEKETEVARVYGVLPVSKSSFVLSRLIIPCLITAGFTWGILFLQPFYDLPLFPTLLFAILSGLVVPVYCLGISILSANKMSGMVWIKVFNILVVLPVAAFFVPGGFSHFFGILPTHWVFQGLSNLLEGEAQLANLSLAFAYLLLLITFTVRRFSKVHFA